MVTDYLSTKTHNFFSFPQTPKLSYKYIVSVILIYGVSAILFCIPASFAGPIYIICVIQSRNPFKILAIVIMFIPINMVDLSIVVWITNKGNGNKSMNMYSMPFAFFMELYFEITMLRIIRFKNHLPIVPNTSFVADLINTLISSYVFPFFLQYVRLFS